MNKAYTAVKKCGKQLQKLSEIEQNFIQNNDTLTCIILASSVYRLVPLDVQLLHMV